MKIVLRFIVFLIINFTALFLCALFMGNPATNEWYQSAHKAPWTPPSWVFGFAWTLIMIFFSLFLALNHQKNENKLLYYFWYPIHLIFIIVWNPVFFQWHWIVLGTILLLLALFTLYKITSFSVLKYEKLLLVPYFTWLCIATSLNAYFLIV